MINFDALVLNAGQNVFGRPIVYTPKTSAPDMQAFEARGVFTSKPVTVALQEGLFQTWDNTLSVRLSEFPVKPAQYDELVLDSVAYTVENVETDGQGAAILTLKKLGGDLEHGSD